MRLAHFSDVHVTLDPFRAGEPLDAKRLSGALNYGFAGRRWRFGDAEQRIQALLADVDAQRADHVLCTGDLSALAFREELERAARAFGPRLQARERFTVLPGNHDRYTPLATEGRFFEGTFGSLSSEVWPWVRAIGPGVQLIALDVTRATRPFDSSGLVGEAQLGALAACLAAPQAKFTIVALHYGLYTKHGRPDTRGHGLRDAAALVAVLRTLEDRPHLVLHGHLHDAFELEGPLHVRCVGSGTDLKRRAGWDLYTLDPEAGTFQVERRDWDAEAGAYRPATPVPRVAITTLLR